jgi:hypothetical protein
MKMLLAFLASDSELLETHFLNKAAAWAAGGKNPYIHVEVVFVEREAREGIIGRSCSIHYGGKVFLEHKRFSRSQWRFRSVSANKEQVQSALKFCVDHVGEGFNKTGYFLQPFAGARLSSNTWFCSEIVAGALNAAGMQVASSLHPNDLFKAVADLTAPDCPREVEMKF